MRVGVAAAAKTEDSDAVQRPDLPLKADFFRVLGHPAAYGSFSSSVTASDPSATSRPRSRSTRSSTSQQLAALKRHRLLDSRRERTSIYYRVRDPRIFQLLEVASQILTSGLADTQALILELKPPPAQAETLPADAQADPR